MRGADVGILILVPLAVIALIWFLDYTMVGKTVKAAASNPSLARVSSISPKLVSTMVWAIAALLSGAVVDAGRVGVILSGGNVGAARFAELVG